MRINHNIASLNTYRQLTANTVSGSKSLEKLSSGLRINRAGDDAAGLAISEKMRAQIRGLDQASRNAQDSISLIQTAEGALNETQSILQRMRELAVQSANDTNVGIDRAAIQDETNQLAREISRISDTTQFNTQDLLKGTFTGSFHIGANKDQNMELSIGNMSSEALNVGKNLVAVGSAAASSKTLNVGSAGGSVYATFYAAGASIGGSAILTTGTVLTTAASGTISTSFTVTTTYSGGTAINIAGYYKADATLVEAVSSNYADSEEVVAGLQVSTSDNANDAIKIVNDAIEVVSKERSKLGAYQNRLEHTISNLDTSAENLTASESRIRDVDMAKEMMEFTKNNILAQAAQAMLAQANQQPQGVLQLLR